MKATKKLLAVMLAVLMAFSTFGLLAYADVDLQAEIDNAIANNQTSYTLPAGNSKVTGSIVIDATSVGEFTLNLNGARLYGDEKTDAITVLGGTVMLKNMIVSSTYGELVADKSGLSTVLSSLQDTLDDIAGDLDEGRPGDQYNAIHVKGGDVTLYGVAAFGAMAEVTSKVKVPVTSAIRVDSGASVTLDNTGAIGAYAIKNKEGSTVNIQDAALAGFLGDIRLPDEGVTTANEKVDLVGGFEAILTHNRTLTEKEEDILDLLLNGNAEAGTGVTDGIQDLINNARVSIYVDDPEMDVSFDYDFVNDSVIVIAKEDDANADPDLANRYQYFWRPESAKIGNTTVEMSYSEEYEAYTAEIEATTEAGVATVTYRLYYKLGDLGMRVLTQLDESVEEYHVAMQKSFASLYNRYIASYYDAKKADLTEMVQSLYGVVRAYQSVPFTGALGDLMQDVYIIGGLNNMFIPVENDNVDYSQYGANANLYMLQDIEQRFGLVGISFTAESKQAFLDSGDPSDLVATTTDGDVSFMLDLIDEMMAGVQACISGDTVDFEELAYFVLDNYETVLDAVPMFWDTLTEMYEIFQSNDWADIKTAITSFSSSMTEEKLDRYADKFNSLYEKIADNIPMDGICRTLESEDVDELKTKIANNYDDIVDVIDSVFGFVHHPENFVDVASRVNEDERTFKLYSVSKDINYAEIPCPISAEAAEGGSVSMTKNDVAVEESTTTPGKYETEKLLADTLVITATADEGYTFTEWQVSGSATSDELDLDLTQDTLDLSDICEDLDFTAIFTQDETGEVAFTLTVLGGGSVTMNDVSVASGTTKYYARLSSVTMAATPATGMSFICWMNADTQKIIGLDQTLTLTAYDYYNVEAVFASTPYYVYTCGLIQNNADISFTEGLGRVIYMGENEPDPVDLEDLEDAAQIAGFDMNGFVQANLSGYDSGATLFAATYSVTAGNVAYTISGDMTAYIDGYNGGTVDGILTEDEIISNGGTFSVEANSLITVVAEGASYIVDKNGKQVSPNNQYTFYAIVPETFSGSYSGESIGSTRIIDVVNGTIYSARNINEDYTIAGAGILLTENAASATEEKLVVGNVGQDGILRARAKLLMNNTIYSANYNAASYYVRSYVTLEDGTTIYSDIYAVNNGVVSLLN